MSRWLAVGEPVNLTLRVPTVRFPIKGERLRSRAVAYVDSKYAHLDEWPVGDEFEEWRQMRKSVRVATLLAERQAIINALDGRGRWRANRARIPRWRLMRRRQAGRMVCDLNRIARWW